MNWETANKKMKQSIEKYAYYEGSFSYADLETSKIARSLPLSRVGWAKRAVRMRANKTKFDKFENDTIGLNKIFNEMYGREALDKIKDDTLVCGVGFLALARDRIMPFTALEATGVYDWYEQNLGEGWAVFQESTAKSADKTTPDSYMIFKKDRTIIYDNEEEIIVSNNTGRPLMSMLTHQSTTKQPFGRSVISSAARSAVIDASRTVRQAMVAGHHYNYKIDAILGVDSETTVDKVESKTGDILRIGTNENGGIPQLGELAQHAMAPFSDTILIAARNFCADTNLSLSNLGIAANAPQSPEALEVVGDDLRDDIDDWQSEIGEQLKYFAVTVWMHANNVTKIDSNMREKIDAIKTTWLPVYQTDVSKFGDGVGKIAEYAPEIVRARSVWRKIGLTSNEIDRVIESATDTGITKR